MHCALCNTPLGTIVSEKDAKTGAPLEVRICNACGLVQQACLPTESELRVYYSHHYREDYKKTYSPKLKYVLRAGQAAKERIRFLGNGLAGLGLTQNASLLDIGAGGGEFVFAARKAGFDACGIEPNEGYSEYARKEYNIDVRTEHLDQVSGVNYDVVTLYHVLEHIADPAKALHHIWALTKPGGFLVVEVPNIEQNDASPANIFFKAHLFYFSAATLRAIASPFFEQVKCENSGNLKILFRRKDQISKLVLPSITDVELTKKRLKDKTWLEYLIQGGGWLKPFRRIFQLQKESRLKNQAPLAVLNSALS